MAPRTPGMTPEIREVIVRMRQFPFDVKDVVDKYLAEPEGVFRKKSAESKNAAAKLKELIGPNPAAADLATVTGAVQWLLGFKTIGRERLARLMPVGPMPANLAATMANFESLVPAASRPKPGSTLHRELTAVTELYKELFDRDDIIWQ